MATTTVLTQEIATIRHFANSGDKMAHAIIAVFDALRSEGKEVCLVRAASTANIASLATLLTIDGQVLADGDLVLVKNQTSDLNNGIYIAHVGAWERLKNYNNEVVLTPGMIVYVRAGSTLQGTLWGCISTGTVVGTDHIIFSQFTAATLSAGSVGSTELASNSVTTVKITDANVTSAKLAVAVAAAIPGTSTITLAGVSGGHIDATVQLKDINGVNLASKVQFVAWVSDAAGGAATANSPTTTVQTGVLLASVTANKVLHVISDATGVAVIRVADTGHTYQLNISIADTLISSANIVLP